MKTRNNNKNWNIAGLTGIGILVIAFTVGVFGFFGCSQSNANSNLSDTNKAVVSTNPPVKDETYKAEMNETSPNAKTDLPKALVNAGEFGENIYDAAKAGDWKTAEAKLNKLKASVKQLDTEKIGSEKLNAALMNLEKSVAAKDKNATLEVSNQLTFDAAELTAKYNPKVPVEVVRLDFYGRELEIWAGEKNEAKLKQTTQDIRKTWDAVKPKIEAHNGTKQAAAFDELVRKTEAAKSISDYAKLATPILDEVDNLEKVFG